MQQSFQLEWYGFITQLFCHLTSRLVLLTTFPHYHEQPILQYSKLFTTIIVGGGLTTLVILDRNAMGSTRITVEPDFGV